MIQLHKFSKHIWYTDYEAERDRPVLGYIRGEKYAVAVDAGHSKTHLDEFYELLKKNDLPLPALTIITHWHWDHSFAMHAINGLSIANRKTDQYLKDFIARRSPEHDKEFLQLDPSIALEYADDKKIIVVEADIVYDEKLLLDAGNVGIEVFEAVSPHTDDATLVYVKEDKVLFLGDAISGVFPTWVADPDKREALCQIIEKTDAEYCIGGHWDIWKKPDLLNELRSGEF